MCGIDAVSSRAQAVVTDLETGPDLKVADPKLVLLAAGVTLYGRVRSAILRARSRQPAFREIVQYEAALRP
jgi:hypothetical protein